MRWSQSIILITAIYARTNATGRSRSSIFSISSRASMGLHHDDHFKRLKIMQDAETSQLPTARDMLAPTG